MLEQRPASSQFDFLATNDREDLDFRDSGSVEREVSHVDVASYCFNGMLTRKPKQMSMY